MRSLAERFQRWFRYEQDVNAKVLQSLEEAPASVKGSAEFQRCLSLMAHIVAARSIWLCRLGGSGAAPAAPFPQKVTLLDLRRDVEGMQAVWSAFLQELRDDRLQNVVEYRTTKGDPFSSTVEDILMQLHGHGVHHRAQIALLLRGMGAEPMVTDFIFWCREQREEKAAG
jgi:uncharacterized damage-inducible protein DinB